MSIDSVAESNLTKGLYEIKGNLSPVFGSDSRVFADKELEIETDTEELYWKFEQYPINMKTHCI